MFNNSPDLIDAMREERLLDVARILLQQQLLDSPSIRSPGRARTGLAHMWSCLTTRSSNHLTARPPYVADSAEAPQPTAKALRL